MLDPSMITTTPDLPGYRVLRSCGLVRGIIVRSRSLLGLMGAAMQSVVGGNITLYTDLCEKTRQDAYLQMIFHAEQVGANAIVATRYDANELLTGVTEILCYGTAVVVEKI